MAAADLRARATLAAPPPAAVFDAIVPAPFGALGVIAPGATVEAIVFLEHLPAAPAAGAWGRPEADSNSPRCPDGGSPRSPLAARVAAELAAYLIDPRSPFTLALGPPGTPFQRRVWRAIGAIAPGSTRRYGDLARDLGSVARAVGQACGDNALPLLIPCHRVVAADGLGGFAHRAAGFHREVKRWLLAHEAPRSLL